MQNVIIYTRVSTDDQALGFSLRDQKAKLEKYCAEKGFEIIKHFQDDHSAKTFIRPEFKKLLEFIQSNKGVVTKLLVLKWDRFSRDMEGALTMISLLRKLGVEVEAIEQPLDTHIPENLLMQAIYLVTPQVENARRSLNTRNGMRKALKEGRWMATAPFGYKNTRDIHDKPIIVKSDKAPLVEEAFRLYASGLYEYEEVRKMLQSKGMTLVKNPFSQMLRNPIYCGKIRISEFRNEAAETVNGIHEPIITEELFHQAQQTAVNRRRIQSKPKRKNATLPLRGTLVCSKCGKNLTGSASKGNGGTYFYYHCQSGCSERYRADIAHNSFTERLKTISIKPEIASLYLAILEDVFKTEEGDRELEISKLNKILDEKRGMMTKAGIKLVNDDLDKPTYKRIKEQLEGELVDIHKRINELKQTESGFMEYSRYSFSLLSNLSKYYLDAELEVKQKLVGLIFPEKLCFTQGEYRTTKPSEVLSFLSYGNQENKKGLTSKYGSQSFVVALTARLSNQFKQELQQIYELKPFIPVQPLDITNGRKLLKAV